MQTFKQDLTIGILGGGQLGRMMALAAYDFGFKVAIYTDRSDDPALAITNQSYVGSYSNHELLLDFASHCDVVTIEFENISVDAVNIINGVTQLYPSPNILTIAQNRILEKEFFAAAGIETAQYAKILTLEDLKDLVIQWHSVVLKTVTGGYDGKGQVLIGSLQEAELFYGHFPDGVELIAERFVDFELELSVIAARNAAGQIETFPAIHNIHSSAILRRSFYPASVTSEIVNQAHNIAKEITMKLGLIGLLTVEMFLDKSGKILVNEIAPRPHNSGHITQNIGNISQFHQAIRAISNLPLIKPECCGDIGEMVNLIGDDKYIENFSNPNAYIYRYGKRETRDGRKMGHVNFKNVNDRLKS